jgi:hypothetical protein
MTATPIFFKIFFLTFIITYGANLMANNQYPSVPEENLKGIVRTNVAATSPTQDQIERKKKYTHIVASMGLPTSDGLPVTEDPKTVTPRSADEVATRAIAVAIAAVKGEGMSHDEVIEIVKDWEISSYFSPDEKNFIENPNVTDSERLKFSWRYEGLDVLLWALGYKDDLPAPNVICDVKADVGVIVDNKGNKLAKNAKLRSMQEIMDMADYYYRLHWAAIELRINGKRNDLIDEEIIMERHYALNWLIRYMNQEWDNISTDT